MSKITELISKMYAFLDSADQSNTLEMREVSCSFAALCREVNEDLEQADSLLKKGLTIDALKFDKERHPSLLSRAATLNIKRFDEWSQVCRLYENWETPLAINMEIVRRMRDAYRSTGMLAPLLEKWRAIMRDGSTAEKLDILRDIHKLDSSNKAWSANLGKLEQVRFEELYEEAKQAILDKDYVGLEKIFLELSSPELKAVPDTRVMEKVTSVLHEYQRTQLAAQARRQLAEIADAYSEQNYEKLQELFKRWEVLESDPEFEPDPVAVTQLEDTRRWMKQVQEERERQAEFDMTLAALIGNLDAESPVHEIDNLYGNLQRLDLPIPDFIADRVRDAREKADLRSARIHRRRLVLGVLTIAAVIGVTVFIINYIQEEKAYRDVSRQMEAAFAAAHYKAVLDQYEHLYASGSKLAKRPAVLKLRDDAKSRLSMLARLTTDFDMTLKAAAVFLTPDGVEDRRLSDHIQNAEQLKKQISVTAKQTAALDDLKIRRETLLQQLKRDRENRFRKAMEALDGQLVSFRKKLVLAADLPKLTGELAEYQQKYDLIVNSESAGRIDRQYRELFCKRVDFSLKSLAASLKTLQAEKQYRRRLESPATFLDYMDALENLESRLPAVLPQYADAVAMTFPWRRFYNGVFSRKDLNNSASLKAIYSRVSAEKGLDPNYRDLSQFVPPEISGATVQNPCPALTAVIDTINSTILGRDYDFYEIILEDSNGKQYHFFCDRLPEFENPRKNSKYPRSMTLAVSVQPGNASPLKLDISGMNGRVFFKRDGELKGVLLPDTFVKLIDGDISSRIFLKARHFSFLKKVCHAIRNASSPAQAEKVILKSLRELQGVSSMNVYMRLNSAKRLLGMLKLTSSLNNSAADAYLEVLNSADVPDWSWLNPREEIDKPAEAAAMRDAVGKLDLDELERSVNFNRAFYEEALSRLLLPAAVVSVSGGRMQIIPLQDSTIFKELWSLTRLPGGEFSVQLFAELDRETGKFNLLKSGVKPFNGMVLFTPGDQDSTRSRLEKLVDSFSGPDKKYRAADYPVRWPANIMDAR